MGDNKFCSNNMINLSDIDWEFESADDEDDFCLANFDKEGGYLLPPIPKTCENPGDHRFEKLLLLHIYHQECIFCGYSPDLDSCKPEWEECHRDYIKWKQERKTRG